jgi:hypothetical protein
MANRSAYRNVFLHLLSTGTSFGGFYQAGSITEGNLLWMLHNVLLIAEQSLIVTHRASNRVITPTRNIVEPGDYDVSSIGMLSFPVFVSGMLSFPVFVSR